MRKKRYCIILATTIVLGQTIILNPSQAYSASVSRVQAEELQDKSANNSLTEEANTGGGSTTPENPQPITPTMPPIVPETPDITLPPVIIGEPVPITPTVPIIPDNTLPLVPVGEPVPITPTAPPIVPEQPDNSLPSISLTTPEKVEVQNPESDTERDQPLKNLGAHNQDKKDTTEVTPAETIKPQEIENKNTTTQVSTKGELPYTWGEANIPLMSQHTSINSLDDADKDAVTRKHAIAVHAAGTGGVVTGIGTSVLLLGILKKASWIKQIFGK